jgi:hypothetical protein
MCGMPPKLATPGLSHPSNKSGMLRLEMQLLNLFKFRIKVLKKGYSFDSNKKVFRPRRDDKNKTCYNYGEKGHISPNYSKPVKRKSSSKNKQVQESSDEEEDNYKGKNKSFERKKSYNKKSSHFAKKKSNIKRNLWLELKNGSPMSP